MKGAKRQLLAEFSADNSAVKAKNQRRQKKPRTNE